MIVGNDDGDNGGGIVGNAGLSIRFLVKFQICKIIGRLIGRAEHKLDPYRVEYIHKRSIFRLDTTTNR